MNSILLESTKIHVLTFVRLKQAVFWSFAFPIFLYIVFSGIFGVFYDSEYSFFLLTGVISMSIASDGLFAIGTIIKQYYQNGTLRILQKMPLNILNYFIGLIISRFLILVALVIILNLVSLLISSYIMPFLTFVNVIIGIFIGLWIFGFVGLCLNFISIKKFSTERGIQNIIYFLIVFTSNALYPVGSFNQAIENIANLLPLNPVLHILRSASFDLTLILIWSIIPPVIFYLLYKRINFSR